MKAIESSSDMYKRIISTLQLVCSDWKIEKFHQIEQILGGLSNELYLIKNGSNKRLIRFYPNTKSLVDQSKEEIIVRFLSQTGFAPKIFSFFDGGRVEEFIESEAVTTDKLGSTFPINYPRLISQQLVKLHSFQIPLEDRRPQLFTLLYKLSNLTKERKNMNQHFENKIHSSLLEKMYNLIPVLEKRLTKLKSQKNTLSISFLFETVFCHNDLLAGNILYLPEKKSVKLIDFEYGCYNYRGYDFANHFCEYCGILEDFDPIKYPSRSKQKHFIECYINYMVKNNFTQKYETLSIQENEQFFNACIEILNFFSICSNILWGLWAFVQNFSSKISFDYLQFSLNRFNSVVCRL